MYQNFIAIIEFYSKYIYIYISYISHNEIKNIYGVFMICWFGKFYVKYIYTYIYYFLYGFKRNDKNNYIALHIIDHDDND